jgi:hypothetical protein
MQLEMEIGKKTLNSMYMSKKGRWSWCIKRYEYIFLILQDGIMRKLSIIRFVRAEKKCDYIKISYIKNIIPVKN